MNDMEKFKSLINENTKWFGSRNANEPDEMVDIGKNFENNKSRIKCF
jgi:hypothetical protein